MVPEAVGCLVKWVRWIPGTEFLNLEKCVGYYSDDLGVKSVKSCGRVVLL